MKLAQYQIDAFTRSVFSGNPACVCPLQQWLDEEVMQAIAAENNQAETAFFVPVENAGAARYHIRWFTPTDEVALCGHATLASAYVLFNELGLDDEQVVFDSLSGELVVTRKDELLELDFPSQAPQPIDVPLGLSEALGVEVIACLKNEDCVVVLESEQQVRDIKPDFSALMQVEARGIIVTAKAEKYDFVNRFFGPRVGVNEDAVTGSAFTKLVPYWAAQLGKTQFHAKQVSARGGEVICELVNDRVKIAGYAAPFMQGHIYLS